MSDETSDNAASDKMSDASDKRSVRGVPDFEWKMATDAAKRAKRPTGEWLSEAIRASVAAERQAGDDILPPRDANLPANQSKLGPTELAGLMQAAAALAAATGIKPAVRDVRRAYGLLDEMVRVTRGLGPRPNMRHRLGIMRGGNLA